MEESESANPKRKAKGPKGQESEAKGPNLQVLEDVGSQTYATPPTTRRSCSRMSTKTQGSSFKKDKTSTTKNSKSRTIKRRSHLLTPTNHTSQDVWWKDAQREWHKFKCYEDIVRRREEVLEEKELALKKWESSLNVKMKEIKFLKERNDYLEGIMKTLNAAISPPIVNNAETTVSITESEENSINGKKTSIEVKKKNKKKKKKKSKKSMKRTIKKSKRT